MNVKLPAKIWWEADGRGELYDGKIPAFDADRRVQFGVTSATGLAWQRKQANADYAHRVSRAKRTSKVRLERPGEP